MSTRPCVLYVIAASIGGISRRVSARGREFRVIPSGADWINCAREKLGEFRGKRLRMLEAVPLSVEQEVLIALTR